MSPRTELGGLMAVCVGSFCFYTWLLYSVLGVPGAWVLAVLGQVAIVLGAGAAYGWKLRMASRESRSVGNEHVRLRVTPQLVMFTVAVGLGVWCIYYLSRLGFRGIALLFACAEMYGIVIGMRRIDAFQRQTISMSGAMLPSPAQFFRAFVPAYMHAVLIAMACMLLAERAFWMGFLMLALMVGLVPWTIRRMRRALRS